MRTNRKGMHQALQLLTKVVDHKSAVQIIRCVKLQAKDGVFKLTATDLERTLTTELACEGELTTCLPAKLLCKLVKPQGKNDDSNVEIEAVGDDIVVIRADDVTTKLASKPAEDFPASKDRDWNLVALWPTKPLAEALDYVLPAASTDETRPHICGVQLDTTGKIVATDGRRLHMTDLPSPLAEDLLLTTAAAQTLRHILKDADQVVIARDEDRVKVRAGQWTLETTAVKAEFPPYEQVVPKSPQTTVTVDGKAFSRALKRLDILSSRPGVKMVINGVIELSSSDPEIGEASVVVTPIENDHTGDDLIIGFNLAYLVEAIGRKDQTARLRFDGRLDPLRIDRDQDTAVVMPMRI